jgi:hypothetical protein
VEKEAGGYLGNCGKMKCIFGNLKIIGMACYLSQLIKLFSETYICLFFGVIFGLGPSQCSLLDYEKVNLYPLCNGYLALKHHWLN